MSTRRRLIVVGAAGFGREVLDVIRALNALSSSTSTQLVGVVDDAPSSVNLERLERQGVGHVGGVDEWLDQGDDADFIVGIGDPGTRCAIVERFERHGLVATSLVHPTATLGFGVSVAPGAVVCAGVQISTEVRLGRHTHINPNVTVGHDSVIEQFVSVNPGAIISGECVIEAGALVGAGAVVLQGLRVGAGAAVGAAACVTRNVERGRIVKGVPARC